MILRIKREPFLVSHTLSTLYVFRGQIGAALGGGVFYGVALSLGVRFGAGDKG